MRALFKTGLLTAVVAAQFCSPLAKADERNWRVEKSSGEVWVSAEGGQQASLSSASELTAGDTIRTGRNGRALLQRGAETVLVSSNSTISIPKQVADGMQTTIVQKAGSILLDVEKQNVKHFEVETPYLAAVVKGTQFRVTVGATKTSVQVLRGQVEVSDFKTGQVAQVLPGQAATSFMNGKAGLSLSGSGKFLPMEQGKPRGSVERTATPKGGTPTTLARSKLSAPKSGIDASRARHTISSTQRTNGAVRISAPLGDVRVNFQKVTHGMARGVDTSSGSAKTTRDSVWASQDFKGGSNGNGAISSNVAGNGNTAGNPSGGAIAAAAPGNNGNGNGNGNNGNGNNGNGNGNGNNGNGNSGNGNGANGNGKGHAYGHYK